MRIPVQRQRRRRGQQGRGARGSRAARRAARVVAGTRLSGCEDHRSGHESPQPVGSPVYMSPTGPATARCPTRAISRGLEAGERRRLLLYRPELQRQQRSGRSASAPLISAHQWAARIRHGPFEVALFGKNLANEVANLGDSRSIAAETPGRPRLFVNQPRTLGIEFRQSF